MTAHRTAPVPRLDRYLWQWLGVGALTCLLLPSARAYDPLLGWLWYWLLPAPAIALFTLHTQRLLGTGRRALRRSRPCFDPAYERTTRGAVRCCRAGSVRARLHQPKDQVA